MPGDLVGKSMVKRQPRRPSRKGKNASYLNVAANVDKLCAFVSTGMNSRLRMMRELLNKIREHISSHGSLATAGSRLLCANQETRQKPFDY